MKRVIVILFTILFFASTAYATLPNQAVFNWIEYKFANMFPKAQTVKSELTHDDVHYDLRSWSGAWGTRYLGITDDGEVLGLGDYTDGVLLSFGYVDEWEDAVIADYENVLLSKNVTTSVVYSEKPNTTFTFAYDEIYLASSGLYFTQDMQGGNHVFYWPSYFISYPELPGLDFVETEPDKFVLTHEMPEIAMGFVRNFIQMDTNDSTIKRFAIVDTGLEVRDELLVFEGYDQFQYGDVWVATDYGSGFEFEQISDYPAFYHNIAAYDIDNNGYDDLVAVNMGVRGGDYEADSLHTFSQHSDGQFEQINALSREGLPDNPWYQINTSGSVTFADLDNDGDKELIQGAYAADFSVEQEWGAVRIWELDSNGRYAAVSVLPREGLFSDTLFGAAGIYTIDYNNDGLLDILTAVENRMGIGQGLEIYRNDGNYQFTRVTETVLSDAVFPDSLTYAERELFVADVNGDGLDDIVCNPVFRGNDIQNRDPDCDDDGQEWISYWEDGITNGFQYNIGASIWLNTGTKFLRQINNPTYTARVSTDTNQYPLFMRYMDSLDGIVRFFGFSEDGSPIVIKVQY